MVMRAVQYKRLFVLGLSLYSPNILARDELFLLANANEGYGRDAGTDSLDDDTGLERDGQAEADPGIQPETGVVSPLDTLSPPPPPLPPPPSPPAIIDPKPKLKEPEINKTVIESGSTKAPLSPVPPESEAREPKDEAVKNSPPVAETPSAPAPNVPVSVMQKSMDLLSYEKRMQNKFDALASELRELRNRLPLIKIKKQKTYRKYLRTADGNRSIASTKLKQLIYSPPGDWIVIRRDIDKAFAELEGSVSRLKVYLKDP